MNLNYIFESLFVGIYCASIWLFLSSFIPNSLILFFLLGFTKHFIGFYSGIHDKYCSLCRREKSVASKKYLFLESLGEGIWFVFLSLVIQPHNFLSVFLMGAFTHILAEWTGVHRFFCEKRCHAVS